MPFRPWPIVLAAALLSTVMAGCGGGGAPPTPTPTPRPSPAASPTATPTPEPPEPASFDFLYREFGQEADTIWRVNPVDPAQRQQLAQIPHAPGVGSWPAQSPDGRYLAYTVFPAGRLADDTDSQAWLLDLQTGEQEQLADRVDLRSFPVWSPDGKFVVVKRNTQSEVQLILVDVFLEPATPEVPPEGLPTPTPGPQKEKVVLTGGRFVQSITPIGYSRDSKTLYFANTRFSPPGTDIGALSLDANQVSFVFQVSDQGSASDWALSPDASKAAFVASQLSETEIVSRAFLADIAARSASPLLAPELGGGHHLRPTWEPQGGRVALGHQPEGGQPAGAVVLPLDGSAAQSLTPPQAGFDVPLSWSPDGRFLLVHSSEGESPVNPGRTALVTVETTTGIRREAAVVGPLVDVMVLGWLSTG